jgi:hypothetical protein
LASYPLDVNHSFISLPKFRYAKTKTLNSKEQPKDNQTIGVVFKADVNPNAAQKIEKTTAGTTI